MGRLDDAWRLLNLPCEGMTRLSSESLDRDLGRLERIALRSHLLYCAHCRRYDRQIKGLGDALRRLSTRLETDDPLPGPDMPEEVREEIKRKLRED
jgi:predicted anti-sigma-YlaC factor YlaD